MAIGALAIASSAGLAAEPGFQSLVEGRRLVSTGFPRGAIAFGDGLEHVARERFVLYGQTDCEIHLFAETAGPRVTRLYWVQFEAYRPHNDYRYDYSASPRRTRVDGRDFYDDVWFMDVADARRGWRPGSDSEHVMRLLEDADLTVGAGLMGIRLVLLDAERRRELMIIYYEDLADHGLRVADLEPGGARAGDWPGIAAGLRQRALDGMRVALE